MKKLAVILLTVSSLLLSASAFAATSDGKLEGSAPRNDKENLVSAESSKADMPCFRAGDTLKFKVSNLTSGNQLTLISYKLGSETDLSNEVIQYINQYTLDANTRDISYQIRNTTDGIYKIVINDNDDDDTNNLVLYYKVGNPNIEIKSNGILGNGYVSKEYNVDDSTTYSIGFLASVTMDGTDVSYADVGLKKVGFNFTDSKNKTFTQTEALPGLNPKNIETNGSISFLYGVTIYNVPDGVTITATAVEGGTSTTAEGGIQ